jgi:hypothetical protein
MTKKAIHALLQSATLACQATLNVDVGPGEPECSEDEARTFVGRALRGSLRSLVATASQVEEEDVVWPQADDEADESPASTEEQQTAEPAAA